MIFFILMKFLKAIRNLLWTFSIELILFLIQKSSLKIWRQKWKFVDLTVKQEIEKKGAGFD